MAKIGTFYQYHQIYHEPTFYQDIFLSQRGIFDPRLFNIGCAWISVHRINVLKFGNRLSVSPYWIEPVCNVIITCLDSIEVYSVKKVSKHSVFLQIHFNVYRRNWRSLKRVNLTSFLGSLLIRFMPEWRIH